jgi:hypothetical protein
MGTILRIRIGVKGILAFLLVIKAVDSGNVVPGRPDHPVDPITQNTILKATFHNLISQRLRLILWSYSIWVLDIAYWACLLAQKIFWALTT